MVFSSPESDGTYVIESNNNNKIMLGLLLCCNAVPLHAQAQGETTKRTRNKNSNWGWNLDPIDRYSVMLTYIQVGHLLVQHKQ